MSRSQNDYKYIGILMCICVIWLGVRDMLTKEVFGTVHDIHASSNYIYGYH